MAKQMGIIQAFLNWLRGPKKAKRYANRPQWVQQELMDKAAAKRAMRAKKRLAEKRRA